MTFVRSCYQYPNLDIKKKTMAFVINVYALLLRLKHQLKIFLIYSNFTRGGIAPNTALSQIIPRSAGLYKENKVQTQMR